MNILRLALTGLFRKKFYTLLLFAVCFAAMQTVLSGITGAAGFFCQQKIFEASVSVELDRVLHLDYQYTEESPEFAGVIRQYLDYIGTLPGVAAVGQFDAEGVYFSELKDLEAYKSVNGALLKGQTYEDYPGISRLLHADAAMLPFVEGGVTGYADPGNSSLPLYVSEVFREILPIGQTLTEERTVERYEVMGYIPKGAVWVEEDDLIRFPVVSLDGWFLAPFSGESRSDIMTQLSCLHNTYVFLADGADTGLIREQIAVYPRQHGFAASARLLSEEYGDYQAETGAFTTRQAFEYHFYPEEYEKEYSSTGRTLPLDRETDYQFRIEAECASGAMEIRVTCGTEEQIYAVSPSEPCRETVSVESGAAEEAQFDIEIQPDTEGGVRVEVLTYP